MLQVGNNGMTRDEEIAHFSLWAALKSPLLISTDVVNVHESTLQILENPEVIAINQDPLGKSARLIRRDVRSPFCNTITADIWGGELDDEGFVVGITIFYPSILSNCIT